MQNRKKGFKNNQQAPKINLVRGVSTGGGQPRKAC